MIENFDWEFYLASHEDLIKAGINTKKKALDHWNKYGKKEGRIYKLVINNTEKICNQNNMNKTVIIVSGSPYYGKSTLCKFLCSDDVSLVSIDYVTSIIESWCKSDNKLELAAEYIKYGNTGLHKMYEYIEKNCPKQYATELFNNFILNSDKDYILVEGYMFDFREFNNCFVNMCKENNIRIWHMTRIFDSIF